MESLRGEKILVTGPAGQIAFPLASRLAGDNEVWGIARFGDRRTRERVETAGIQTRAVDLADPDWVDLPDDFSFVLHLAASMAPGHDYDLTLRVNAQGTGHLMSRFRNATACLVMSTCGVYASPEDPDHAIVEGDPLGGTPQPYSPTYCVSKIGEEAVARFAAREFGLPTTIARMNVAYGDNGGYPAMLLEMILADQPIPLLPGRAVVCSPIHEDDIIDHTPRLLDAASIPAMITNWGGDEPVEIPELCRYMAELVGKKAEFVRTPEGIHQYRLDTTRRTELAGRCRVSWRDGVRRMIAARHPELGLRRRDQRRGAANPGTG
ncbi:MAG: NAD(P)-dependent oxidoreductase [Deltaproteobacteria bacterium]|nr:NAD(P)-dependent oxidoreductase [Deltaproteobacteria bacterium]